MKKRKKPKAEGAPLYMGQYASLMTILLAFFIAMLTMGTERLADYRIAFGDVQTAFGLDAGVGVLRFIRMLLPDRPVVEDESEDDDRYYLAYRKGTFQHRRLDRNYIEKIELEDMKQVVRVETPVAFPPGSSDILPEDQAFLDRMAGVFLNLRERHITVACYSSTGRDAADQALAARRATAIVRYLDERGRVSRDRMLPVGYSESRYLGDLEPLESDQAVLFFIGGKPSRTGM